MSSYIKYGKRNITYPKGFEADGICCGIKKSKSKKDLAVLSSKYPANTAIVSTKNTFRAAPVLLNEKIIKEGKKITSLIVNSGNANAGTGSQGVLSAELIINSLADNFSVNRNNVLSFSTGSIGVLLPHEKIIKSIPVLKNNLSVKGGKNFSEAIMTTDAFSKTASAEISYKGQKIRIGASCKGAGMIAPQMATMLCFITTDVMIPKNILQKILKQSNELSFNRISVDGDMSTNDSVVLMANGASGASLTSKDEKVLALFSEALTKIMSFLAEEIVRDGEGASKVMHIRVYEAASVKEAKKLSSSLANSPLLKCAVFGEVPNWGRILSTVGASGVKADQKKFRLFLQGHCCYEKGEPDFNAVKTLKRAMLKKKIEIDIYLGVGKFNYDMKASDFGFEYVEINRV